ncbi:hypothetical protein UYO_1472 [Lachnospiraceae bacterium JC7]|nr:hypothetical protein UYO_1472 [Lachnospiraceae bacterium JC7]
MYTINQDIPVKMKTLPSCYVHVDLYEPCVEDDNYDYIYIWICMET